MTRPWPDGARCVVALTVDFDGTGNEVGRRLDPDGSRAAGGYSARRGVPRYLEIFARHNVPATFFVPGYDAEANPRCIRDIVSAGHEVAAHGYLHESWEVPLDQEEALLRRTHEILTKTTGIPPVGWRAPAAFKSDRTLVVLGELGYIYDSTEKDFDAPYPAVVQGQPSTTMLELPNNNSSLNDHPTFFVSSMNPSEVLELWKSEFEAIYHDTGYFVLTLHPRAGFGSGIPSRAHVIDQLISHIKEYPAVHFTRMDHLARWCLERTPEFIDPWTHIGGYV